MAKNNWNKIIIPYGDKDSTELSLPLSAQHCEANMASLIR